MAKEKRIADLPGISSVAVVALNRMGLLTASDLAAADYDRVAFVLEDFSEATRLVNEARKYAEPKKFKADSTATSAPSSPAAIPQTRTTRMEGKGASRLTRQREDVISSALATAATTAAEGGQWRTTLQRRLGAAAVLLEHECSQHEVAAVLLLDLVERGAGDQPKMSADLEELLEECISLRAVPTLPNGKLPRYFLEMAASASSAARRVCAAAVVAGVQYGGAPDRLETHLEALLCGPDEPLVMAALEAAGMKRLAA